MKISLFSMVRSGGILAGSLLLATTCATRPSAAAGSFASVKPVLESSCVHCHGAQRLPGMPSMTDTGGLAALTGSNGLIVPGRPEESRFFTVVKLADSEAGAMPPTGHALADKDVAALSSWILAGAPLPAEVTPLIPAGQAPRSR